ncbi:DUF7555 family protein [Halovivax limisalsi]|uniref:DUF7555 family protein n=1 Tax=Halovivax limisalsi TaxID=1453760 RepID=UPI001FFC9A52|nr:hypothetical protein [Halovivax limisalsi]
MGVPRTLWTRLRRRIPAWIDAITYALVLGGLLTAGALLVALGAGGDLTTVKYLLFGAGWVLLAIATVRLWPSRGGDPEPSDDFDRSIGSPGRVQRLADDAPPARWVRQPTPHERLSSASKQFLAAIITLAISILLEVGIGA